MVNNNNITNITPKQSKNVKTRTKSKKNSAQKPKK